jgi:RHS repeat-associated protein
VKLKTEQRYDPNYTVTPSNATNPTNDGLSDYKNTDYVGNIVYETAKNGSAITNRTRILVDGGYYEGGVYYYYLTDHLGNNRVVVNQSGTVTQKNHYYPFGTAFADKYDNGTSQPYKYNGKELDQMHQLNLYDYSARYYESAIGRFTSVDPLAEKYYGWSPYAYVMNNPLKYIDPTGGYPIWSNYSVGTRTLGFPFVIQLQQLQLAHRVEEVQILVRIHIELRQDLTYQTELVQI